MVKLCNNSEGVVEGEEKRILQYFHHLHYRVTSEIPSLLNIYLCLFLKGSVGRPFPGVEVAIGRPNAYIKAEYDIIAKGNQYISTVAGNVQR